MITVREYEKTLLINGLGYMSSLDYCESDPIGDFIIQYDETELEYPISIFIELDNDNRILFQSYCFDTVDQLTELIYTLKKLVSIGVELSDHEIMVLIALRKMMPVDAIKEYIKSEFSTDVDVLKILKELEIYEYARIAYIDNTWWTRGSNASETDYIVEEWKRKRNGSLHNL